jgi:DNA polymerase I-like protein with 3'-5' exonuclease and polymerase domains
MAGRKRGRQDNSLLQGDLFDSPMNNSTGWAPPMEFPRLHGMISLDLETRDDGLRTALGPGWPVGNGHPTGVAVATADAAWYFPTRHAPGGNVDERAVWRWLRDQLGHVDSVVMQNATYDLGWLRTVDVAVPCPIHDTKAMAALLDENRNSYSLEALGKDYLGQEKRVDLLDTYAKRWGMTGKPGENIWRMPPFIVGPYAEMDARLTFDLAQSFLPRLAAEDLLDVYQLEMDLVPVLLAMRARGMRVDVPRAEQLREQLLSEEADLRDSIKQLSGESVDPWDVESVARALKARGIVPGRTEAGAVSITKEFLAAHADERVAHDVLQLRRVNKLRSGFVEGAFLAHVQNGRMYPEFHPLRSDDGGAVTGRFSSSNPNAQQFPARREEDARLIRGLILPEDGCQWFAADYNQQEPRMLVHFASLMQLRRAGEAAEAYRRDPRTDFHQFVADLTGLPRKIAKNINLGKFYGMGGGKYARSVGLPVVRVDGREYAGPEAQAQLDQYDAHLPFVSAFYQRAQGVARERGWVRTIVGRRRRFQPVHERGASPHKALNAVIQGSSADQNKRAMVALHRSGVALGAVVHDEIDGSAPPEDAALITECMQDCLRLEVPSVVDLAWGPTWGEAA